MPNLEEFRPIIKEETKFGQKIHCKDITAAPAFKKMNTLFFRVFLAN
jgi:hypothetical protein